MVFERANDCMVLKWQQIVWLFNGGKLLWFSTGRMVFQQAKDHMVFERAKQVV